MKYIKNVSRLVVTCIAAFAPSLFAQLSVPSDGSDGVLNVTTNTVIDLSKAVTGIWSNPSSGTGIYDPSKWAVVFKYFNVNIANGATVTFSNHYANPPVIWLVQSNVIINGMVVLNGTTGTGSTPSAYDLTIPGPGGFRGGAVNQSVGYGDGLGPGGGVGYRANGTYASKYGNIQIVPLIGGSGSATGDNCGPGSGGAGGGAILIAAGGNVTVNGQITATPGAGNAVCGLFDIGAGGGIRIVANQIAGNGAINATPEGRTRVEANINSSQLTITPNVAVVTPGPTPLIFPPASTPTVNIVSVAGQSGPSDPQANVTSSPDIGIATNGPVTVVLQTQNFPTTGNVTVRVVPTYGLSSTLTATNIGGNSTLASWQLTAQIPLGYCVLQAHANAP